MIRQDGSAHVGIRRFLEMRDRETAFELKRLHTFRKHADYDFPFPNGDPTEEARSAINRASRIIAAIDALENYVAPPMKEE